MLWVTYPVSVPSCHDDRLFSVLYDNLRSNLVTIHRMGWAHDWTQRLDAFGQWYIFSFCLFPWYPQPTCTIPSRVSSIRRHQTTVMTQPTPSSPAMGPRLKTQDNNNNNNKRGGGDMGDYPWTKNPLCPRMDVARVRGGAGGEPHTDGWITCCCLKRPPRQEKISQCGSSFCLSNGLITKCGRPLCTLVYLFLPFRTRRPVHM